MSKKYLLGIYADEHKLLESIHDIRQKHIPIFDVRTPFAVHGMEEAMGMKRSRIPLAGFIFGMLGTITALSFISWVNTSSWPLNIGGKPFFGLPAFIPITFELTVLFSAISMVAVFLISCGLYPGKKPVILDDRITDHKFLIAFDLNDKHIIEHKEEIQKMLSSGGAEEVKEKEIE